MSKPKAIGYSAGQHIDAALMTLADANRILESRENVEVMRLKAQVAILKATIELYGIERENGNPSTGKVEGLAELENHIQPSL